MSLQTLFELLSEVVEAIEIQGLERSFEVFQHNVEIVIQELQRDELSISFSNVIADLTRASDLMQNLVDRPGSNSVGRPRLHIPEHSLRYLLFTLNFKITQISKIFSVSPDTIRRRLNEIGLTVICNYHIILIDIHSNMICVFCRHPVLVAK